MQKIKAEDLAYDKWPEILIASGIDAGFFGPRNGPCPFCGGADRYRWSSKHGGVWVCSMCTEGKYASGFRMLMDHMNYSSFMEAANHVRNHFGSSDQQAVVVRERAFTQSDGMAAEQIEKNRQRMLRFWNEARDITPGDPVSLYMANRCPGIDFNPHMLRYHPALDYWLPPESQGGRPTLLGKFPAMLAYAQGADGQLAQLHKTYLTPQGHKADVPDAKKTDYGIGLNSFAIRMFPVQGDTLGVCEGIETGWASVMLKNIPVWPCLNATVMSNFVLPQELVGQVKRLVIFSDHDELKPVGRGPNAAYRRAGSHYAEQLAQKARHSGLRVLIIKSSTEGFDMANQWARQAHIGQLA